MSKRKYTKRSEYWNKFKSNTLNHNLEDITNQSLAEEFSPELVGESLYETTASRLSEPTNRSGSRTNSITQSYTKNLSIFATQLLYFATFWCISNVVRYIALL